MKSLLDILHSTDAIEIDGTFCRYFTLEIEECETDDDIALHVDFECDGNLHEHFFTKRDLEGADKIPTGRGWYVYDSAYPTVIVPYKLTEIAS